MGCPLQTPLRNLALQLGNDALASSLSFLYTKRSNQQTHFIVFHLNLLPYGSQTTITKSYPETYPQIVDNLPVSVRVRLGIGKKLLRIIEVCALETPFAGLVFLTCSAMNEVSLGQG